MNLQELFNEFIAEQELFRGARKPTIVGYQAAFSLFTSLVPGVDLADLNTGTVKSFFIRLNDRRVAITHENIKASTIHTYRSKLNSFFKWLAVKKYIEKNPIDEIPRPKVDYNDKRYLDRESVEKILNAITYGKQWKNAFVRNRNIAIFHTFLFTGIRRSELIHLRLTDVDIDNRTIFINGDTSKSRENRSVPLHPNLAQILTTYIGQRMKLSCSSQRLFVNEHGDELTLHGLKHLVNAVEELSGVHFHLHQFRHTFAVNVLNGGADIAKLKQLLGHKDILMTSMYLRQIPQKALKTDIDALSVGNLL